MNNKLFYQNAPNGELDISEKHGALDDQSFRWIFRSEPICEHLYWHSSGATKTVTPSLSKDDAFPQSERHGFAVAPPPRDTTQNGLTNRSIGLSAGSEWRMLTLDPIAPYSKANDRTTRAIHTMG